jgi:hypothetical protein
MILGTSRGKVTDCTVLFAWYYCDDLKKTCLKSGAYEGDEILIRKSQEKS